MLSVVCPTYNEEKYIRHCIESILSQDFQKGNMEVLFVDGMSTDKTRDIIAEYQVQYPYFRIIDNPDRIVPYAMNRGIDASVGEVIIRLDAHADYQPNYFSALVRRLYELEADNVGTVCKTDVLNKTPKALAIKEVLGNKFGVGNSIFRTGVSDVQQVDTVPFGCWQRGVFEKYGLYDVRLVRNQDIELNKRIIRGGGKIFIVPDTFCTYYARETFKALAKNNFGNGKWNIMTVWFTKYFKSLSIRHFIPAVFVLSLILPMVGMLLWKPIGFVALAVLIVYLLVMGGVAFVISLKKRCHYIYLLMAFMVLHFSYGIGSLFGIMSVSFIKK